jgi:predicted patatin/cPLA2 family phospholipase
MEKDPKELKRVYNIGVKEAQRNLKAIQSYLSE